MSDNPGTWPDLPPLDVPPEELTALDDSLRGAFPEAFPAAHGGRRPGSGRKPKQAQRDHAERFNKARADKEESLAKLRALEARKAAGELAPIDTLRDAMVDVLRQVVAHLDAIPGKLKREAPHLSAEELQKAAQRAAREWAFRPGPMWTFIKELRHPDTLIQWMRIGVRHLSWIVGKA